MRNLKMLPVILSLFDGGAAGAGAGAAGAGGAAPAAGDGAGAQQGDTNGRTRGAASRGKSGESSLANVRYGKQAETGNAGGDQVRQGDAGAAKDSEETLRAEFLDFVNGKYKGAYAAEVQKIIDKRFADAKRGEAQLQATQPVVDLLMQRYKIGDGNLQKLYDAVAGDDPTVADRAEENGMTVEQQRMMDKLERDNAALRRQEQERVRQSRAQETANKWMQEAVAMQEKYPDFDLRQEASNPEFLNLLRAGIPMEHAYEVIHREEINRSIQAQAAAETEKRVSDNIRAQGMRPRENGTSSQGGFVTTKVHPSQLGKADHREIRERVRRGERIEF